MFTVWKKALLSFSLYVKVWVKILVITCAFQMMTSSWCSRMTSLELTNTSSTEVQQQLLLT